MISIFTTIRNFMNCSPKKPTPTITKVDLCYAVIDTDWIYTDYNFFIHDLYTEIFSISSKFFHKTDKCIVVIMIDNDIGFNLHFNINMNNLDNDVRSLLNKLESELFSYDLISFSLKYYRYE